MICRHCRLACEGGRVAGVFDCGDWLQLKIAAASKAKPQAAPFLCFKHIVTPPFFDFSRIDSPGASQSPSGSILTGSGQKS